MKGASAKSSRSRLNDCHLILSKCKIYRISKSLKVLKLKSQSSLPTIMAKKKGPAISKASAKAAKKAKAAQKVERKEKKKTSKAKDESDDEDLEGILEKVPHILSHVSTER